jgi:hypothetical protein
MTTTIIYGVVSNPSSTTTNTFIDPSSLTSTVLPDGCVISNIVLYYALESNSGNPFSASANLTISLGDSTPIVVSGDNITTDLLNQKTVKIRMGRVLSAVSGNQNITLTTSANFNGTLAISIKTDMFITN